MPADRSAGSTSGYIAIGEVVDVENDPWQAGNAKVRWKIGAASQSDISDNDLPWTRSMFPSSNPSLGQVGGPHTGLRKGSIVVGVPLAGDGQDFLIIGTIVKGGSGRPDRRQTPDSDVPRAAKENENNGLRQPRYGDVNDVAKKLENDTIVTTSICQYAQDEAGPDRRACDYATYADGLGAGHDKIV